MKKKITLSKDDKNFFKKNGYLIYKNYLNKDKIKSIKVKIPKIFDGYYDTGISPDKVKWDKFNKKKIPRQLCNVWKSNKSLRNIITNRSLAEIAAKLMGWSGIKLGQDSLMWVPPLNGGVSMHQDNPYQDWHTRKQTITCIIALTNISEKSSGIQFLKSSHLTKKSKPIKYFFNGKKYDYTIKKNSLKNYEKIFMIGDMGTISFHHGNIWHGSDINNSSSDRVSISIHYIPLDSKYSKNIKHPIYSRYKKFNSNKMDENFFPILWSKGKNKRSNFLT